MAAAKEPLNHVLIPEHVKLSDKEKEVIFSTYNISIRELPKIMKDDPAIAHLDVKVNDVIMIKRQSETAGSSVFYRGVIDG